MADRDDSSITRLFNGAPLWAKVVASLGIPAVLVLYFLARDAGYIHSPMVDSLVLMRQHMKDDQTTRRLLWAICQNIASSEHERRLCNPEGDRQ